jgi:membrane protein YdbS with pleckstrin-like domain
VPIRNAQVIVVEQTPFDRWNRVATLIVDTAGQAYTGGGPRIHNVPAAEAIDLARALARQAGALCYRV